MGLQTGRVFYEALEQDSELVQAVGGRIYSTAIDIPPMEEDNTPLPYLILTIDGLRNDPSDKEGFEGHFDVLTISVEVAGEDTDGVAALADHVRGTVRDYFERILSGEVQSDNEHLLPEDFTDVSMSGIQWDWEKPCYWTTISWTCDVKR